MSWSVPTLSAVLTVDMDVVPVAAQSAGLQGWGVSSGLSPAAGTIAEYVAAQLAAGPGTCTATYQARTSDVCGYVLEYDHGSPISAIAWVAAVPSLGIISTAWEVTGANTARYVSGNVAGAWNGGGAAVLEDEDRIIYTSEVSVSPYDPAADTYVTLGAIPRQRTRWSAVMADHISPRRAEAVRPDDPNNILQSLIERSRTGEDMRLWVEGRPMIIGRLDESSPSWSDYATQVGTSGQRYDVDLDFRVVA